MADKVQKRRSFGGFGFGFGRKNRSSGGNTSPQGVSSIEHSAGYISSKEKSPELASKARRYKTFSEMIVNTPVISASMGAFFAVMKNTEWEVDALEDNPDSERYKEVIDEAIDNLESGWPQIIQRLSGHAYWGFAIGEWVAKQLPSGSIGFKDIYPRSQHTIERWDIDENTGEILGIGQENVNTGEELYIDRRRMVYAVDNSITDSPEGLGILRKMFTSYKRLENYLIIEEIGFDTDLRGVPVVKAPLEELNIYVQEGVITAERREEILDLYRNFLRNHTKKKPQGIMHDSEMYSDRDGKVSGHAKYSVELMKGDGSSALSDLQTAIKRERNNLALLLSTGFLLLGEDGAGSLALSKTKIDAFLLFVTSTLKYMAFVIQRDIIKPMGVLNGWDEASLPKMKYEEPKAQDIIEITDAMRNLSTAFGPLPQEGGTLNEILVMMGLKPIEEEFIVPFDPDLAAGVMPGMRESAAMIGQEEQDIDADSDDEISDKKKGAGNGKN